MSVRTQRQYRQISSEEVQADAGLSVRQLWDLADAINNFNTWVSNHKAVQLMSGQQAGNRIQSHLGTAEERVIGVFAPVQYQDGPDYLTCRAGVRRIAGTEDIVWRVYCSGAFYSGPVVMDTGRLTADYSVTALVCSSDAHARPVTQDLDLVRAANFGYPYSWMVLTAQNGDASTQGVLLTLDVWPETSWVTLVDLVL